MGLLKSWVSIFALSCWSGSSFCLTYILWTIIYSELVLGRAREYLVSTLWRLSLVFLSKPDSDSSPFPSLLAPPFIYSDGHSFPFLFSQSSGLSQHSFSHGSWLVSHLELEAYRGKTSVFLVIKLPQSFALDLWTPDSHRRRLAMRYNDLFVLQLKISSEKPSYYPAPDFCYPLL